MTTPSDFPYDTRLDVRYEPLRVIDLADVGRLSAHPWFNQTLCRVNDSVVRVGILAGEYHWHKHDEDDEFFFVVEGRFLVDLEERTVELRPGQGIVVPHGVVHRTRAPERCVVLMVETAAIVPTGD
jgi:mannose-6-phosphate isomerase-like protein (cupin superfamily)